MDLSSEDIDNIALLARLAIDEEEKSEMAHNLANILRFAQQMNDVDTSEILPMAHPLDACQRLREDVVTEPNQHDHLFQLTPHAEAGLYLVPQVIENVE